MKTLFIAAVALLVSATALAMGGQDDDDDEMPKISNHVVLFSNSDNFTPCSRGTAYFRQHPDGTVDDEEFVVPAGHALVIVDVSWSAIPVPQSFDVGNALRFQLFGRGDPDSPRLFRSAPVEITASNVGALLGGNETLNAGVVVGSGQKVCSIVRNEGLTGSRLNTPVEVILRGHLVKSNR